MPITTVVLFASCLAVAAQTHGHENTVQRVLLDGASNPTLIPDSTAVRIFFLTLIEKPDGSAITREKLLPKLSRLNLDLSDYESLETSLHGLQRSLGEYHARLASIAARRAVIGASVLQGEYLSADRLLTDTVLKSYKELEMRFSAEGQKKLRYHIQYVKTKLKIVGPPDMSKPAGGKQ
ncbi:MAG: hypothetical protein ACKV2U_02775 [Bryobacteraceae bacterium]